MAMEGDLTGEYRDSIFVGVARGDGEQRPQLEDAFEDAYEKAKNAGKRGPFQTLEIVVHGSNPISEYRVVLKSHSG